MFFQPIEINLNFQIKLVISTGQLSDIQSVVQGFRLN